MQAKGNDILFTCREKEFAIDLLKSNKLNYISLGKHYKSIYGKILGLFKFELKLIKVSLNFKPDVFLSAGSFYAAHVSFLIRKPHITLENTENMEQIRLFKPFTKYILTPDAIPQKYGKKQIRYNGFHQSAFLHPNYFKKSERIKSDLGIPFNENIFLLRLVALNASHDMNVHGISNDRLISLVNFLNEKGKLYISSEKPILKDFEQFRLNIPPDRIHDFISICDLVIGESSSMSNEAGYLGVPNIFIEDIDLNVLRKYSELGLKIHYKELNEEKMDEIKSIVDDLEKVKNTFKKKSEDYIKNSIDLTEYIISIVESKLN